MEAFSGFDSWAKRWGTRTLRMGEEGFLRCHSCSVPALEGSKQNSQLSSNRIISAITSAFQRGERQTLSILRISLGIIVKSGLTSQRKARLEAGLRLLSFNV